MRLPIGGRSQMIFLLLFLLSAFAGTPLRELITFEEYQADLLKFSKKVNLFRAAWNTDPKASFTGGTVRDYILWYERQFIDCRDLPCVKQVQSHLDSLSTVDIRDFILEDSDIDIVTRYLSLNATDYGVKKIDHISDAEFNPSTDAHKSSLDQGYIPAERMLLSSESLTTGIGFGNGVKDLFDGKLNIVLPDPVLFWKTNYAAKYENHPILLVERYIRVVSLYYNSKFKKDVYPRSEVYKNAIPEGTLAKLQALTESFLNDANFRKCLKVDRFVSFHNKTVTKSFRAYTNPTVTMQLYQLLGLDKVFKNYRNLPPINQFLFAKPRLKSDLDTFKKRLEEMGFDENEAFSKPEEVIPGLKLYHGTRTEEAFADIQLRGVVASGGGSAGMGLYGVTEPDKGFSEQWGGDKNRLISFDVNSKTRVVDIRQGVGKKLFRKLNKHEDEFADYVGADILIYPYSVKALVVKNAAVLSSGRGVYRSIVTLSELMGQLDSMTSDSDLTLFLMNFDLMSDRLTTDELNHVAEKLFKQFTPLKILQVLDQSESFSYLSNHSRGFSRVILEPLLANISERSVEEQVFLKRHLWGTELLNNQTLFSLVAAGVRAPSKDIVDSMNFDKSKRSKISDYSFSLMLGIINDNGYTKTPIFDNDVNYSDLIGKALIAYYNPDKFRSHYTIYERIEFFQSWMLILSRKLDNRSGSIVPHPFDFYMTLLRLTVGTLPQSKLGKLEARKMFEAIQKSTDLQNRALRKKLSKLRTLMKVIDANSSLLYGVPIGFNVVALLVELGAYVFYQKTGAEYLHIMGWIHGVLTGVTTIATGSTVVAEYSNDYSDNKASMSQLKDSQRKFKILAEKILFDLPIDPRACEFKLEN